MALDAYAIVIGPWITEKALDSRSPERGNRLEFIVHLEATKGQIAEAIEELFEVKVEKVNTRISKHGKHASVKLAPGFDAEEAALKLGAF